uniref:N-terminal EF-hand calcium binding protein 2 n=1 Tax=Accipiter nisus TaxID=211598 RepID=A0A8B9MED6_9AVES
MGDYEDVLASLETLNLSILKAMDYTKRVYESGSNVDQFVTRFLLKETANQTQSLLSSVESAVDAIDEQTNPARSAAGHSLMDTWYDSSVPSYSPTNWMVPREHGKSFQTGKQWPLPSRTGSLEWLGALGEGSSGLHGSTEYLLLVRDEMTVSHKHLGEFCSSLKQYLKSVAGERDCFHVTAVKLPDGVTFIVYEFWETEEDWKRADGVAGGWDGDLGEAVAHSFPPWRRHLQSATCKGFQHVKVDTLSQPEAVSSVAVWGRSWCGGAQ